MTFIYRLQLIVLIDRMTHRIAQKSMLLIYQTP